MDPKTLISRSEVADWLRVKPQTIAKWEREGTFPRPKERLSDRVILYDAEEVQIALARRAASRPQRMPPRKIPA